jgi:beta-glucosidase-like glycosyl hydrolase
MHHTPRVLIELMQNGEYAVQEVRGMQEGEDPKWPLKIHATLKHYTAYSVETDRLGFIGNVSTHDVYDSFLPQYAAAFTRGQAAGVMCVAS